MNITKQLMEMKTLLDKLKKGVTKEELTLLHIDWNRRLRHNEEAIEVRLADYSDMGVEVYNLLPQIDEVLLDLSSQVCTNCSNKMPQYFDSVYCEDCLSVLGHADIF